MDFDFDRIVSENKLKASGWELGDHHIGNPIDSVPVYITHYPTQDLRLFCLPESYFHETLDHPFAQENLAEAIAHALNSSEEEGNDKLAKPLLAYIQGSLCYRKYRNSDNTTRMHYLINIYEDQIAGDRLRPFIMNNSEPLMPPEMILHASNKVKCADQDRHPDWFS